MITRNTAVENRTDRNFGRFVQDRRAALGLTVCQASYRADAMPEDRWKALESGNVRIGVRPSECRSMAKVLGLDPATLIAIAGGVQ